VGSFRESREAEGLKAHLASLGIEAYVEQATTTGADQWHRVRVGPFTDLERLNQVRARLAENSIAAILVKF
jgi:cell division protein FtsN